MGCCIFLHGLVPLLPNIWILEQEHGASSQMLWIWLSYHQRSENTLFAFSGSNMILDVAIFLVPLTEYLKPGLKRKQVLAMTGLFGLGAM
jgi:hypothetical protein